MPAYRLSHAFLSQLLVVDMQERLMAAMPQAAAAQTIRATENLLQAAGLLDIPVLITEQYPRGLGGTVPALTAHLPNESHPPVSKTEFSALGVAQVLTALDAHPQRRQIVIAGIEAHICVLQTALDLIDQGFEVFVVADAAVSRNPENRENAMQRMAGAGAIITNSESVMFEWLGNASHPAFREISRLITR